MPSELEKQGKYWCFTRWNETENSQWMPNPDAWSKIPQYLIGQVELCPDTNRVHFQGYVCFRSVLRGSQVQRLLGNNAHVERRRGKHSESKTYCSKVETRLVASGDVTIFGDDHGIPEGAGARTDLAGVMALIDGGATELEVATNNFTIWCRYYKAFNRYAMLSAKPRNWEMTIISLIGPTGCGKTRMAYDTYPDLYSLSTPKGSGTYWDGYSGQEVVLIDEMYGNRFSWGALLMLLDRYPFKVPVHGGFVEFTSKVIILISNKHPRDWYTNEHLPSYNGSALERRLEINPGTVFHEYPSEPILASIFEE